MSYNTGQGQFGNRGNMWAMIRSIVEGKGSINASMQKGLGTLQVAKATYDFTVDGGAVSTISPVSSPLIPAGAIILGGIIHSSIAPTSGGGATIAIGILAGAQAALIKGATAIATYALNTPIAVLPIWSGGFFKVAVEGKITFTVATAALTAGKIDVHIVYVMAGE